jgi:hypothetical protein
VLDATAAAAAQQWSAHASPTASQRLATHCPCYGPGKPQCMAMVHAVLAPVKGGHPAERQNSVTCLTHQPAQMLDIKTRMCAILHESANHPKCPMILHEHNFPTDSAPTVPASTVPTKQHPCRHTCRVHQTSSTAPSPVLCGPRWACTVHPSFILLQPSCGRPCRAQDCRQPLAP